MRSVALARATGLLAIFALLSFLGCASAPPNLTPEGRSAFHKTRVIKGLDLLRDFAIDAEAQTPKVLPTATTRKVVQYHQSTLKIIASTDSGWQAAVTTGLDQLLANLSDTDRAKLGIYADLIKVLIVEVTR